VSHSELVTDIHRVVESLRYIAMVMLETEWIVGSNPFSTKNETDNEVRDEIKDPGVGG
jgi:hypothetical protein